MNKRVLSVLAFSALACAAWADVQRATLLPEDAVVRVRFSHTGAFLKAMEASSLGQLWKDDQMQAFLNRPDLKALLLEALSDKVSREAAEASLEEYRMLGNGELVIAFVPGEGEPYGLSAMPDTLFTQYDALEERLVQSRGTERYTREKTLFQGVAIYEEHSITEGKTNTVWEAHLSGTLVHGPKREWVEKTIVALLNQKPAEPPDGAPTLTAKIHTQKWLDQFIREMEDKEKTNAAAQNATPGAPQPPKPSAVFTALGVRQVQDIVVCATAEADHLQLDTTISILPPFSGILKLLDVRPTPADLRVSFLPANVLSYSVGRLDLNSLWREIPVIIRNVDPEAGPKMDEQLAGITAMTGVDLGKEFFAYFDSMVATFAETSGDEYRELIAFRLTESAALEASLARMFNPDGQLGTMLASVLKIETFRGHSLYQFTNPQTGEVNAFGVAAGYLLLGNVNALRDALTAADTQTSDATSGFYSSARYQQLCRMLPDRPISYGTADVAGLIQHMIRTLAPVLQAKQTAAAAESEEEDDASPFGKLDFSKLPSAKHIASFFGPSFNYTTWDGQRIRGRALMYYKPE